MTMSPDCQRWMQLSDKAAVADPLNDAEREFLLSHPASCQNCTREADTWRALLVPHAGEPPSEQRVAELLSGAARQRVASQRGRWVVGAGGALAAAAAVAFLLSRQPTDVAKPSPVAVAVQKAEPAEVGSAERGPTCSDVVAGVTVCSAPETHIVRRDLERPERQLLLGSGRVVVSLTHQPAGSSFSIATDGGRVTAIGTVFSVERTDEGTTIARVLEGKVAVRLTAGGEPRPLAAGQSLRLGDTEPNPLAASERERDLLLLPEARRAELERSKADTAPPKESARVVPSAASAVPAPSLELAQSLRARGDFRGAADVYRKISANSKPSSAAGGTALVSLGELLLSSLGDPGGALSAFDQYLVRGGSLAQEAAFGRARALRALNRTTEERQAIERFVATYPDAPQSRALRKRLAVISQ